MPRTHETQPNTDESSGNQREDDGTQWEKGDLGRSEEHAERVSQDREKELHALIDESLELKMISIRLQKGLIKALKELSKQKGIGYQPLIRQILTEYVRSSEDY